jgi:hypothetical protein
VFLIYAITNFCLSLSTLGTQSTTTSNHQHFDAGGNLLHAHRDQELAAEAKRATDIESASNDEAVIIVKGKHLECK